MHNIDCFSIDEIKVFLTTDIQFCLDKLDEFSGHIIFQDCETQNFQYGSCPLIIDFTKKNQKKMWLYHYGPGPLPDAKKDGFCGFVKRGQTFEFSSDPGRILAV